jgi:hypothetical protein
MFSIERKILKTIKNENDIDKKYLESKFKCKNTSTTIDWLLENKYVDFKYPNLGSKKLVITDKGTNYLQELDKIRLKRIKIEVSTLVSILVVIVAFLLNHYCTRKENNENRLTEQEVKDTTFFLQDYLSFNELVNTIENKSNYVFTNTSNRIFEITYSGGLIMIRNNYFYYPGGNLVIKYNQNIYNLESLRIDRTLPDGTLNNELNEELNRRILRIVRGNKELLANEIISILNR